MKGFSLISEIIVVAIVVTSSIIIINIATPIFDEGKEYQRLSVAKDVLNTIDVVVYELAGEAPGAKRVLNFGSLQDILVFSGKEDRITIKLPLNVEIITPGTRVQEGNLILFSGSTMSTDDNGTDMIMENDALLFSVKKIGDSATHAWVNTTQLITMIRNKQLDINVSPLSQIMMDEKLNSSFGVGFSELTQTGGGLSSAGIRFVMNQTNASVKYEVLFTLSGSHDFVEMEVKNIVI